MTSQTVFISGANRGLGLALSTQCVQRGDTVFAACRNPHAAGALQALSEQYPGRLTIMPLDVADAGSIVEVGRQMAEHVQALDLLINNAGVLIRRESLATVDAESLLYVMRVNAVGPVLLVQQLLPLLRAAPRPRVINISSQLGSLTAKTNDRHYSYGASKAALNMFTRTLALELAPEGVIVVAVHPGWVQTDMGGPRAQIPPHESAAGILALADRLTAADSNRFWTWQGVEHPW